MSADRFPVLLVDDGELNEVRDCLLAIGADFAHLRGGAVPARLDPPRDLFVTSTRHAALARTWPAPGPSGRPVRIAVVTEDSGTLRATLRRLGFRFLVRLPVHPVALRLLLTHALYRGDERRAKPRVPLGYRVAVKIGMRRRDALLMDLSESGCRLLVHDEVAKDAKVTVQIPTELCGDEHFILPGRALRCEPNESSPLDGTHALAVHFGALGESVRALLQEALQAHRLGTGTAAETAPETPVAPIEGDEPPPRLVRRVPVEAPQAVTERRRVPQDAPASARPPAGPRGSDRRRHARHRYARRVIAASPDGTVHRVLIGRDLSTGGMRVDRSRELGVGSRLRIALYDAAREAPVVVEARVVRDDGDHGLALRFENVPAEAAARVEQLVATLPPVECLFDGEAGSMGTVVAEIVG